MFLTKGLSELFKNSESKSSKFCGKDGYKSPEVLLQRKGFDAKKNDIWCLGVCFFMLVTGLAPWRVADKSDETYCYILKHGLSKLFHAWNLMDYVDANILDLMQSIFQYEKNRISLDKIMRHPWMKVQ